MGRRGRQSRPGKRFPNGKRKPEAAPYDRGSDWVQAQRERFGVHYGSGLGRAYAAGLLGDADDAARLYDAGKAFARTYNRVFGGSVYRCPLDDTPRGGRVTLAHDQEREERERQRQAWLYAAIDNLDQDGSRPWLDQLIHANYVDSGPPWLDRLLAGSKDPVDRMFLDAAIRALDIIAPEKRTGRILAA